MNQTTPKSTPFLDSIRWLEVRCGFVPLGWQLAYSDALRKLMAVNCEARAQATLTGPFMDDINVRITQRGADPVVSGILRRLECACANTCEVCGRPGKIRCLDRTVKVLCAGCAGPRLASVAVTRVLRDLDETADGKPSEEIWWTTAPVQLRPIIPTSAWQVLEIAGTPSAIQYTSHARLATHRPWLEAVRRALDQAVEARDPP